MQLDHSFTVPLAADRAYLAVLDIEQVVPCMPGATLDTVEGDNFTGSVKVKLGPIMLTYMGKASIVEKDAAQRRVVMTAQGRDTRGNGTASARVTATLSEDGDRTRVDVRTDLDVTGKPAQFGRGVMVEVGNKLIGQFADCLAGKLGDPSQRSAGSPEPDEPASAARAARPITGAPVAQPPAAQPEAISLLPAVGPAIAKRALPLLAAIVLLVLGANSLRQRRKRQRQ
jgi:carbon monoxide dehydrogenase subunit G